MSEPEHVREILKRVFIELESKMTRDFDSKLSGEIDIAVSLQDSLNAQVGKSIIGTCPDHVPSCNPSSGGGVDGKKHFG